MKNKNNYIIVARDSILKKAILPNINHSVRIHDLSICKCNRIKTHIKNNLSCNVIYVIEKMWNDEENCDKPSKIFILGESNEKRLILDQIFKDDLIFRKKVHDYFREYEWSSSDSENMRKNIHNMTSICFCKSDLLLNEITSNATIVLLGDKTIMRFISHSFNKYVSKTEYSQLISASLNNLKQVPKNKRDHDIETFLNSTEIKELPELLHTIIGQKKKKVIRPYQQNNFFMKNGSNSNKSIDGEIMYSFSFGKREWFQDYPETSPECAKRELYEEFNIQLSKNIFKYNITITKPQKIYTPGSILYLVYIPPKSSIIYHKASDTIYLDCE